MTNRIDKRWSRWVTASIRKALEDALRLELGQNFLIFIEGEPEDNKKGKDHWIEMRIDGPNYLPTAEEYKLIVEINLLVCSIIKNNTLDHNDIKGVVEQVLSNNICLFKYNKTGTNDGNLGTLKLSGVFSNFFGRIEPTTPMVQSTVETRGEAELAGV